MSSIYLGLASIPLIFVLIFYVYVKYKFRYWKKKNIPYIEPSFPFGSFNTPLTKSSAIGKDISKSYKLARHNNWKCLGFYNFGGNANILVTDLELVKHIMTKDFEYFTERGTYFNEKDQPLSAHLFAIGGMKWRNLRTKFSPVFTTGKIKSIFEIIHNCAKTFEANIKELHLKKETVNIKSVCAALAIDVIGSVAFGIECNSLRYPESEFPHNCRKILSTGRWAVIKEAFMLGAPQFSKAIGICVFPKYVENFFNEIVQKTVEYREKNNVERKDILQLLIDIRRNDKEKRPYGDGTNLTMDEMVAQSFIFFFAGFETTSTTMTFAFYHLASNQEIQDKVRKEIRTVLNKYNNEITYDALKEMVYLQQVIDETLRLNPPVPHITRVCVKDYKVPDMDLVIEKGCKVFIPVRGIHYDENIYADPKVFDPDRFLSDKKNDRHQYAFIPFGSGPRICIGMRFGLLEAKIGLATILKDYKLTVNYYQTKLPLKIDPFGFFPNPIHPIYLNIDKTDEN